MSIGMRFNWKCFAKLWCYVEKILFSVGRTYNGYLYWVFVILP